MRGTKPGPHPLVPEVKSEQVDKGGAVGKRCPKRIKPRTTDLIRGFGVPPSKGVRNIHPFQLFWTGGRIVV